MVAIDWLFVSLGFKVEAIDLVFCLCFCECEYEIRNAKKAFFVLTGFAHICLINQVSNFSLKIFLQIEPSSIPKDSMEQLIVVAPLFMSLGTLKLL